LWGQAGKRGNRFAKRELLDKGAGKGTRGMRWSDPSGLRGGGEITLFALACAIVLAIAFYGVNVGKTKQTASALPAENTHAPAGANSGADTTGVPRVKENGVKG
jgi:hypothetical protein